jgi:hypothetical protein
MSRKKQAPSLSAWVQVVVSLAFALGVTAGTGQHNGVPSPRPPTVCTQLRVLSGSS